MGLLPPLEDPLREPAIKEVLRHRDLVSLRSVSVDEAVYDYSQGWRLVEELHGGADYLLFLDHRSFVNVPLLLHALIPKLPATKVIQGCLLDETLFGLCNGQGDTRCDYLWRRRAPRFPHGMGFILSSDVAKFISEMGQRVPLRQVDIPADVALGMWIQSLEDLEYDSVEKHFHEFPVAVGGISNEGQLELRSPLSEASAVVWPMSALLWRNTFNAQTCSLSSWTVASDDQRQP